MGGAKNPNVLLKLESPDQAAAERLRIVEPNGRDPKYRDRAYVFAIIRSPTENNLSYAVIARNEDDGAAVLEHLESAEKSATNPLRNVLHAFRNAPEPGQAPASPSGAGSSGGGAAPGEGEFSSCCGHSTNVAVILAGRNAAGQPDTVTLLDRYVDATFDESNEDDRTWPMTSISIKTPT